MTADLAKLDAILAKFRDTDGALLPVLHAVQDEYGYVPPDAVLPIAKALRATAPQVYAVITFYSEFRTRPHARKVIGVCRGPACRLAGAPGLQRTVESHMATRAGYTSQDSEVSIETVSCLGICALAPAISVGHDMVGRVDAQQLESALGIDQPDKGEAT